MFHLFLFTLFGVPCRCNVQFHLLQDLKTTINISDEELLLYSLSACHTLALLDSCLSEAALLRCAQQGTVRCCFPQLMETQHIQTVANKNVKNGHNPSAKRPIEDP